MSVVLLAAIDRTGPEYGYRLLRTIQEASGGALSFKEGTAYPLLQSLERMGLVTSFWSTGDGGPPRKYYQITRRGKAALDQALIDWASLTRGVGKALTEFDRRKE